MTVLVDTGRGSRYRRDTARNGERRSRGGARRRRGELPRPRTAATIEAVHGELPATCAIEGTESIFDCSKAARVLGWEPDHSWRDAEDASVVGPAFV